VEGGRWRVEGGGWRVEGGGAHIRSQPWYQHVAPLLVKVVSFGVQGVGFRV
jgi:hypothetical protein